MAGVAGRLVGIPSTEVDDEWAVERHGDALECLQVGVRDPTLQAAHDHPAETSSTRELDARPATPFTTRLDVATDPGALFLEPSFDLDGEGASPDAGHDRDMFIPDACLAIT